MHLIDPYFNTSSTKENVKKTTEKPKEEEEKTNSTQEEQRVTFAPKTKAEGKSYPADKLVELVRRHDELASQFKNKKE